MLCQITFFIARKRSYGKVMFLDLSGILFTSVPLGLGVCTPHLNTPWTHLLDIPFGHTPLPWTRTP